MSAVDIVVPLYNQRVFETPVIECFKDRDDVQFYVCDNSTDPEIKEQNRLVTNSQQRITYIDMGGNKGIAIAYNTAIKRCKGDIICIFDDDTTPGNNYVDLLKEHVVSEAIYMPIVKNGDRVLSPLNMKGPLIYPVQDISKIDLSSCSAFNTGMAFPRSVVSRCKHNEKLFIEFIDHDFCRQAHRIGMAFRMIPDAVLEQDYSVATNSLEAALHRDRLGRIDVREYYSGSNTDRIYGHLYLAYRAVRNTLRYKTLAFLLQN